MAPVSLLEALTARAAQLRDVEVVHLHTEVEAPYVAPACRGHLRHNALFVGSNVRDAVASGRADFTPVFLSEIPTMLRDGPLRVDVAFLQLSPPDAHGFCRLGLSAACARAAADHAAVVVAELNPRVPSTSGNTAVHVDRIAVAVETSRPLPLHERAQLGEVEVAIGRHVAALIPDGATLQMGIGAIPDAVLQALADHRDLGIHTEMFSDGLVDLFERGVVTNRRKTRFEGRAVASFAVGSERLQRFVDRNPVVEFHPSNIVNDPNEIGKQHLMFAINSAIQIDLTGQICADSLGERIYSGIGGQMDFVQGAVRSPGGAPIFALPSTAAGGTVSRIVPRLAPGAGVVTTRGHVQWVVTEHGAVNLHGRTLRDRARLLTSIAAPPFRDELAAAAAERFP
jgi:acetyl-CoA hydrolase